MLLSLASISVAVYAGLCASLFFFQDRLVYFPSTQLLVTPRTVGLDFEDVRVESSPGVEIHAWFVPHPAAKLTVLFCHGNAGNISHRLETLGLLHALGVNVLIFDYAGYGASQGRPSELQTYADARAAWRHLVEERATAPGSIVVFGRSLGAGVATALAAETRPAGVVLESAFTSAPDLGARLYPLFPVRWLARIHYDNETRIAALRVPVLIAHSRGDEVVPFDHGMRLHEVANEPKTFVEMSGGHNDGFVVTGRPYVEALERFFAGLAPPS